ncbi:MAG TPA: hypothetical protein PLU80_03000 [Acidobacteriota bacterium]|nr:hypothetical protein [Acidobacteriota bacterium]
MKNEEPQCNDLPDIQPASRFHHSYFVIANTCSGLAVNFLVVGQSG